MITHENSRLCWKVSDAIWFCNGDRPHPAFTSVLLGKAPMLLVGSAQFSTGILIRARTRGDSRMRSPTAAVISGVKRSSLALWGWQNAAPLATKTMKLPKSRWQGCLQCRVRLGFPTDGGFLPPVYCPSGLFSILHLHGRRKSGADFRRNIGDAPLWSRK